MGFLYEYYDIMHISWSVLESVCLLDRVALVGLQSFLSSKQGISVEGFFIHH